MTRYEIPEYVENKCTKCGSSYTYVTETHIVCRKCGNRKLRDEEEKK